MKAVIRSLFLGLIVWAAGGCFPKKLEPLATLYASERAAISDVSVKDTYATIVSLNFSVTNPNLVTEYGYVYSTDKSEPTRQNAATYSLGSVPPSNTIYRSVTGLTPKVTYYIRPYIRDQTGDIYGDTKQVTTKAVFNLLRDPGPNSTGPPGSAKGWIWVLSTLFMLNDDIYAITNDGINKDYNYYALSSFNVNTKQWTQADFTANAPVRRYDAVSFVLGNKAYVGLGSGNLTDIAAYSPNKWESVKTPSASSGVPELKSQGGIGYTYNGKGYIWNGIWSKNPSTGVLFNDGTYSQQISSDHIPFWEYDPGANSWNLIKAKITPDFIATMRQSPFHFVVNDRLYMGGGQALHPSATTGGRTRADIWELNLSTYEVRTVAKLPSTFTYEVTSLSTGNYHNLAADVQGVDWKRGYILDVPGKVFVMDVTDPNKVSITATNLGVTGSTNTLVGNLVSKGDRLFFLQTGSNQQVIEIFP